MDKASLVVWLGQSKTDKQHISTTRSEERCPIATRADRTSAKRADLDAYQDIYDAIMLFDDALEQFDSERDYQVRKVIEHLALDALSLFRQHSMTVASEIRIQNARTAR